MSVSHEMSTLKRVYLFRDKLCREIVRTIPENRLCKINVNYQHSTELENTFA